MSENGTYQNLTAKIWQSLDILQDDVEVNDYHILIFFLLLKKEDIFTEKLFSDNNKISVESDINSSKAINKELLLNIYRYYESAIIRIKPHNLTQVLRSINNLDVSILTDNFTAIVDELIYKFSIYQSDYKSENLLPIELSKFICSLVDRPRGSVVYNPFAGIASLGIYLDSKYFYYGQEKNTKAWAIGNLWLLTHKENTISDFINSDPSANWNPSGRNIDVIISNILFENARSSSMYGFSSITRTRERNIIDRWLYDHHTSSKLIIFVPQGFVNYYNNSDIIKKVINNDFLESVIYFPNGVLPNTTVSASLLIFNRNKYRKDKVCFVDASKYFDNVNIKEKILDNEQLSLDIKKGLESDSVKEISNFKIKETDYSLSALRYFTKTISLSNNERLEKLSDFSTIYKGMRGEKSKKCKFVRIKDLKNDSSDFYLDVDKINDTVPQINSLRIDDSVVLLALRWKTIKSTYFKYNGSPIYINRDILALKIDESKIDISYLINEFHSDYVIDQLNSIRIGDIMPSIRRGDLMNVLIKLNSLDEQKAKIEGIKESSVKLRLLDAERNARAHGLEKLIYERFSTTKHSLGKPLLNINSSIKNIESALGKINPEWKSFKVSEVLNETLEDTFKTVYSELKLIHNILKNSEHDLDFDKYDFENMDVIRFVRNYLNGIKFPEKIIKVTLRIDETLKKKNINFYVKGNYDLLEIVLNNIIDNANKHAFIDPSNKYNLDFKLSIFVDSVNTPDLTSKNEYLKIEIANNGEPFPKNFTLEKLIRKNSFAGPTGNSGIGGYDINNIIKHHNGKFDLIVNDEKSKYATIYIILLPINIEN